MKAKELTQDTDSKVFWALRAAYEKAGHEISESDKKISDLKWELDKAQRILDSATATRKEVAEHAASLGWTLDMKWENEPAKRRVW